MDSVVGSSHDSSSRKSVSVNGVASGADLTRGNAADRWGHSHSLVDASTKEDTRVKIWAVGNVFRTGEFRADFFSDTLESGGITAEIENGGSHGGGCGVRSSNDAIFSC